MIGTVLTLMGSPYRLSPEQPENLRPWVLVLAGPHLQGAVGIALGRLLRSLNYRVHLHCPVEEVTICKPEELLFLLSDGELSRNRKGTKLFSVSESSIHTLRLNQTLPV